MSTKIQVRRGTAAQWATANPTLDAGEIGFETDTGKLKIGNARNITQTVVTGGTSVVYTTAVDHGLVALDYVNITGITTAQGLPVSNPVRITSVTSNTFTIYVSTGTTNTYTGLSGTATSPWNSLAYITDVTDLTGTSLPSYIVNSYLTKVGALSGGTAGVVHASIAGALTTSTVTNAELAGSIQATKLVGTDIATVGTITSGTWNGGVVAGQYGGTGIANTGKTITLGGNLTTSGAFATTLTTTAATSVTLPTTGTLVANTHATLTAGTTAMALATNSSVIVTPNATATYTSTVPAAGLRATVIILTSGTTSYTITFGTGFKPSATLATGTTTAKYWTVNFISDGTNLIEIGRTGPL